jgi:hypothetical protein
MSPVFFLLRKPSALPLLSLAVLALAGCGAGPITQSTTVSLRMNGRVFGGQQPIGYSTLQLWAAGTGGNATAAVPLIPAASYYPGGAPNCTPSTSQTCNTGVVSDASGSFTLNGDYTCIHATDQIYITAQGGNPGLSSGTNNAAMLMLDVLGSCVNLGANTDIYIDEVTTAAAAWALAPFMGPNGNIAASATNTVGIGNAFLNAQLLANSGTGAAATLPPTLTIESSKLYALANSLASCVNSDGGVDCQPLFSAATVNGAMPTNTLGAALNVVRNPANNVTQVFQATSTVPPFPTSLGAAPNDWTMTLTISGASIYYPTALGIDSLGDVWVGGYFGVLNGFSPQGATFSSTGYGLGTLSEVYGLAVDQSNNIWATNEETPYHGYVGSLTKFNGVSSGATLGSLANGTQYLYGGSTDFPLALAADTNGNMLGANYGNSSASVYNSSGMDILDVASSNQDIAFPVAVTFDATHGLWVANQGDTTISHFDLNGNLLANISCCDGANGIATDASGNAWVANYYGSSVSEVSNLNAVLIQGDTQGGVTYPSSITVDAAQNIWVANFHGSSITELAGNANTLAAGTGISPPQGYGLDAGLIEPFGIAVDPSGNVWTDNFNGSTVTMFFGLATPTATPRLPVPTAP